MSQGNNDNRTSVPLNLIFTQLASSSEYYSFRPRTEHGDNSQNINCNEITQNGMENAYFENNISSIIPLTSDCVATYKRDNYDILKQPVLKLSIYKINNLTSEHELINTEYITPYGKSEITKF
jgi:hypothetical protein